MHLIKTEDQKNRAFLLFLALLALSISAALTFWALTATEVRGDDTDDVTVSATLQAFLMLSADGNITLGNLIDSSGNAFIGDDTVTITSSSNSTTGYGIQISSANDGSLDRDGGGGSIEGASGIHAVDDDGETDGYGAQCGGSSGLDCLGDFDTATGDNVVKIDSTLDFASTSDQLFEDTIDLIVKASSDVTNPDGTYEDTLTLTAVTSLP